MEPWQPVIGAVPLLLATILGGLISWFTQKRSFREQRKAKLDEYNVETFGRLIGHFRSVVASFAKGKPEDPTGEFFPTAATASLLASANITAGISLVAGEINKLVELNRSSADLTDQVNHTTEEINRLVSLMQEEVQVR